jgi:hypothetical protein
MTAQNMLCNPLNSFSIFFCLSIVGPQRAFAQTDIPVVLHCGPYNGEVYSPAFDQPLTLHYSSGRLIGGRDTTTHPGKESPIFQPASVHQKGHRRRLHIRRRDRNRRPFPGQRFFKFRISRVVICSAALNQNITGRGYRSKQRCSSDGSMRRLTRSNFVFQGVIGIGVSQRSAGFSLRATSRHSSNVARRYGNRQLIQVARFREVAGTFNHWTSIISPATRVASPDGDAARTRSAQSTLDRRMAVVSELRRFDDFRGQAATLAVASSTTAIDQRVKNILQFHRRAAMCEFHSADHDLAHAMFSLRTLTWPNQF